MLFFHITEIWQHQVTADSPKEWCAQVRDTRTQDDETHSRENKQHQVWEYGGPNLSAQATGKNSTEGCPTWRMTLPHHSEIKVGIAEILDLKLLPGRKLGRLSSRVLTTHRILLLSPTEAGRLLACQTWRDPAASQRTGQLWTGIHGSWQLPQMQRIWKQFLSHSD